MALYHAATLSPTKVELLTAWVPMQPWSPDSEDVNVIGGFRFDDPEGQVGIESFVVEVDGVILHVPLTYRSNPLPGHDGALVTEMHHSALGTRWVYDGVHDDRYVMMAAAVALTGQGEALGMVDYDGQWHIAPTNVRIHGGGWGSERVSVDGFTSADRGAVDVVFTNDRFELTIYRRPGCTERQPLALAATWPGQDDSMLLAAVIER